MPRLSVVVPRWPLDDEVDEALRDCRIGLTMSKLPDKGKQWLATNERRFEEKWGWTTRTPADLLGAMSPFAAT